MAKEWIGGLMDWWIDERSEKHSSGIPIFQNSSVS